MKPMRRPSRSGRWLRRLRYEFFKHQYRCSPLEAFDPASVAPAPQPLCSRYFAASRSSLRASDTSSFASCFLAAASSASYASKALSAVPASSVRSSFAATTLSLPTPSFMSLLISFFVSKCWSRVPCAFLDLKTPICAALRRVWNSLNFESSSA